jgi:hypothetical protein
MKELVTIYKKGGFNISDIHCDNEFHKEMDPFSVSQTPPIKMKYVAAQEHVPRAERNNRVIQDRVRAAYHRFPYTHLPHTLVKYLVMESPEQVQSIKSIQPTDDYASRKSGL